MKKIIKIATLSIAIAVVIKRVERKKLNPVATVVVDTTSIQRKLNEYLNSLNSVK